MLSAIHSDALWMGWVGSPFNDPYIRQMGSCNAFEKHVIEAIPKGRWASIKEFAEAILFLACDRSSFMNGHALFIDGSESIA